MAARGEKIDLPVHLARRYLEPGPIVLLSSRRGEERNIMTLGWHTIMEFSPSLVGCMISSGNHSFQLIRDSGECVINLPTTALTDQVVGIGNTCGAAIDKFATFGLTAEPARRVAAPLVGECHAHFECRLFDDALVERYNFFIFEVVEARVRRSPRHPQTLHYTGDGVFVVAGKTISRRALFTPDKL
ncbi:flavin reductase family protein [Phytopseudomonas dryadis]|uniref:Flavin reductase n=1 Tax=Phytopseudomonas dryadis TaxID=2487520 RepID=A0A4Q9QTY0_9GAMM|nr:MULTISPECIES: flavin reductase family protein [Pseudomonas]TBU86612.1 flavin reductase [Pseudomonas dryadis]TBV06999.1 flavin reductase [Pseudomonas dryadis]TBV19608.1 flavin reductase [Pseudomonas sp. FRB 230]